MGYYVAKDLVRPNETGSYRPLRTLFFILKAREKHGDEGSESRDQFPFEKITPTAV